MRRVRHLTAAGVLLGAGLPVLMGSLPAARASATCASADAPGGDWPSFGHDLANTRSQPAEDVIGTAQAPSLQPEWTLKVSDTGGAGGFSGTPVVADGCVFAVTDGGTAYAVNADTGDVVWSVTAPAHVTGSVTVADGRVYAVGSSTVAFALDEATGALLWEHRIDDQPGVDAYASPVVYNGLVFAGFSGGSAELSDDEAERYAFQGGYAVLDAATGDVLTKQFTVHPPNEPADDLAGGAVWSTGAVDTETGFLYVGTGNPFNPRNQSPLTNAIIKVDLRRDSASFGQIVGSYQGNVDEYFTEFSTTPCVDIPGNPAPWYPQGGGGCADVDLDFGASPNLFTVGGKKLVGDGQKSGVYHAVDADTMAGVWKSPLGVPTSVGGIVGTAAFDGTSLTGPITTGGYHWNIGAADGLPRWAAPGTDGVHWGHQVSTANGVVYTTDTKGFLTAMDAATGVVLFHQPVDSSTANASLGAGVSIARHKVYAPAGGSLTAFKAGAAVVPSPPGGVPDVGGAVGDVVGDGGGGSAALPADPVIVSGPGAFITNYATLAMVKPQGNGLTYLNLDPIAHDVQADGVFGPDTNPWCPAGNFPLRRCPLFWSPVIGVGQQTAVLGTKTLPAGTYPFYCSIHPGMKGSLVVV
jgi:polyvinyl alcohol dehydrogenase (cytochrome)